MKPVLVAGIALALLFPVAAFAQSAFDGTWETQLSSVKVTAKPHVMHLRDGIYECNCTPPIKVTADGQDHAVTGHHGYDTVAVQVINTHAIHVVYKKHGKTVSEQTFTASADGKAGTNGFTDYGGTSLVTGKVAVVRVGNPTSGVNAVNGAWNFGHAIDLSANARMVTYKVDGKSFSYSDPTGLSYTAEIGGKPVAIMGPGSEGQTVSVKELAADKLQATIRRDGKVQNITTATVAKDGKTMKTVFHNPQNGNTTVVVADRQ